MVLVRTIPRLGALPELFGFYCAPCRRAETIEHSVLGHYAHDAFGRRAARRVSPRVARHVML
jgi:hypothetical protein